MADRLLYYLVEALVLAAVCWTGLAAAGIPGRLWQKQGGAAVTGWFAGSWVLLFLVGAGLGETRGPECLWVVHGAGLVLVGGLCTRVVLLARGWVGGKHTG